DRSDRCPPATAPVHPRRPGESRRRVAARPRHARDARKENRSCCFEQEGREEREGERFFLRTFRSFRPSCSNYSGTIQLLIFNFTSPSTVTAGVTGTTTPLIFTDSSLRFSARLIQSGAVAESIVARRMM